MLRTVSDKSGRMRQTRVVAYLKCSLCLTGATQEIDENLQLVWSVLRNIRNCISPKQPECLPLGPTCSLSVVVLLAVVGSKVVIRNCPTARELLNDDEYLLDEEILTIPYHVSLLPASQLYTLISTCPDITQQEISAQMTRTLGTLLPNTGHSLRPPEIIIIIIIIIICPQLHPTTGRC